MALRSSLLLLATCVVCALALPACDERVGQTVESAYIYPLPPIPKYSFSRHGSTSVDYREVELVEASLGVMYRSYLRPANLGSQAFFDMMMDYYERGYHQGYAPIDYVSQSEAHRLTRTHTLSALQALLDEVARISGLERAGVAYQRNVEAKAGTPGYVGDRLYFVDARGVVVAEVFKTFAMGAIYLDGVSNVHTPDKVLFAPDLQRAHEDLSLLSGKNYTALEHHWDMAYGHYRQWQSTLRGDGVPLLKGREQAIFEAFVRGRWHIGYYDYAKLRQERDLIHRELAKAIAIRAMYLLIGPNTMANLREEAPYAFLSISQAIGLLRGLPFALGPEGKPYFTHSEVDQLLEVLLAGQGLWDTQRLLSDKGTAGSLLHLADRIGRPFGISSADLVR